MHVCGERSLSGAIISIISIGPVQESQAPPAPAGIDHRAPELPARNYYAGPFGARARTEGVYASERAMSSRGEKVYRRTRPRTNTRRSDRWVPAHVADALARRSCNNNSAKLQIGDIELPTAVSYKEERREKSEKEGKKGKKPAKRRMKKKVERRTATHRHVRIAQYCSKAHLQRAAVSCDVATRTEQNACCWFHLARSCLFFSTRIFM